MPPEQRPTLGLMQLLIGSRPGGAAESSGARGRGRGLLLYLLPLPLLPAALFGLGAGRLDAFIASGVGFALFMAAGYLTRRGTRAEQVRQRVRFTRLPRVPLQNIGGLLTGLATALTAGLAVGHSLAVSLAYGVVALLGFHLSYGFVRSQDPAHFPRGDARARKVAAALAEAERKLLDLERAAQSIANPELRRRLQRIGGQGRLILDRIAERPTDLFRARKFLNVYLDGVQQVADGYARTHRLADSRELEQNFRNVLVTVEQVFDEQQERLLQSDVTDLDIQIEVLKKQLDREGLM